MEITVHLGDKRLVNLEGSWASAWKEHHDEMVRRLQLWRVREALKPAVGMEH